MSDAPQDFTWDEELAVKPVTRIELWQTVQLLRATISEIHIYHLAALAKDDEDREEAARKYTESRDRLDTVVDGLIGLVAHRRALK